MMTDGDVRSMKVVELKQHLRDRKLPSSGVKAELVRRLIVAIRNDVPVTTPPSTTLSSQVKKVSSSPSASTKNNKVVLPLSLHAVSRQCVSMGTLRVSISRAGRVPPAFARIRISPSVDNAYNVWYASEDSMNSYSNGDEDDFVSTTSSSCELRWRDHFVAIQPSRPMTLTISKHSELWQLDRVDVWDVSPQCPVCHESSEVWRCFHAHPIIEKLSSAVRRALRQYHSTSGQEAPQHRRFSLCKQGHLCLIYVEYEKGLHYLRRGLGDKAMLGQPFTFVNGIGDHERDRERDPRETVSLIRRISQALM